MLESIEHSVEETLYPLVQVGYRLAGNNLRELAIERKKITNKIVQQYLQAKMHSLEEEMDLEKKSLCVVGKPSPEITC